MKLLIFIFGLSGVFFSHSAMASGDLASKAALYMQAHDTYSELYEKNSFLGLFELSELSGGTKAEITEALAINIRGTFSQLQKDFPKMKKKAIAKALQTELSKRSVNVGVKMPGLFTGNWKKWIDEVASRGSRITAMRAGNNALKKMVEMQRLVNNGDSARYVLKRFDPYIRYARSLGLEASDIGALFEQIKPQNLDRGSFVVAEAFERAARKIKFPKRFGAVAGAFVAAGLAGKAFFSSDEAQAAGADADPENWLAEDTGVEVSN